MQNSIIYFFSITHIVIYVRVSNLQLHNAVLPVVEEVRFNCTHFGGYFSEVKTNSNSFIYRVNNINTLCIQTRVRAYRGTLVRGVYTSKRSVH